MGEAGNGPIQMVVRDDEHSERAHGAESGRNLARQLVLPDLQSLQAPQVGERRGDFTREIVGAARESGELLEVAQSVRDGPSQGARGYGERLEVGEVAERGGEGPCEPRRAGGGRPKRERGDAVEEADAGALHAGEGLAGVDPERERPCGEEGAAREVARAALDGAQDQHVSRVQQLRIYSCNA